jgi:amino acid adenylation domain-containing protein/thioester reductase-like protein
MPGLEVQMLRGAASVAKFDLSLYVTESAGGLEALLEYNTDLFDEATIVRLAGHLRTLLEGAAANPDGRLSELPLLTEAEQERLRQWNATDRTYPEPHVLTELLERQLARTPGAVAVRCEGRQLTYRELHRRANQLAHWLRRHGAGPDTLVAVFLERGPELVAALVGVLKSGAAYVPLEPDYPPARLAFLLEDAGASLLLTQPHLRDRLPEQAAAAALCLDEDWTALAGLPEGPPAAELAPEHLAYVIYTSGSTGQPKGAMNSHRAVCNRLLWMQEQYRLTPADAVLQKTPIGFDVSVWEFFWPLLAGARLVLARPGGHRDPAYLAGLIRGEGVTVCHFVPSMLRAFLAEPAAAGCAGLLDVVCSGEALPADLVQRFHGLLPGRLHNLYGPTEAAVDVSAWECPRGDGRGYVPIGRPIANVQLHVLDASLRPVPLGVAGELYIGGAAPGRGYWRRPELTAERFVQGPDGLGRLYRTGDRARWRAEGVLEYLGRLDGQVKLRGLRIELGEIESVLVQHPGVRQAAVVAHGDRSESKCLVAFLTRPAPEPQELRAFLKERLPEYMVPSSFVLLDALPLSPNGKLDRKALPAPEQPGAELSPSFEPPQSELEKTLAGIWAEVLQLDQVGIRDNFFDLGGHSLALVRVRSQVRDALKMEVPLQHFFAKPTIAELAELIEELSRTGAVPAVEAVPVASLAEEVVLDPDITPAAAAPPSLTEPERIFLTGATGYLGTFLLHELLRQTRAEILCLVRSATVEEGKSRLHKSLEAYGLWDESLGERIRVAPGDLSQPLLGLSRERFDELAAKADVVFHNGALVNLVSPYEALKAANVFGTREVLRLACQSKIKPVHYISTVSVFDAANRGGSAAILEQDSLDHNGRLFGGYAQSKWVAEKLIVMARDRGLPVAIYRPGRIIGAATTGAWSTDDFLCGLIKACVELGLAPDLDMPVEAVPVDYVSGVAVRLSLRPESLGQAFHLVNPAVGRLSEVLDGLDAFGYPLRRVPYSEWSGEALRRGEPGLEGILRAFLPASSAPELKALAGPGGPTFDCRNTLAGLAGSPIACPSLNTDLVGRYLTGFVHRGFLPAPPGDGTQPRS